jgi:pimeloyl-ACP methyl ester carboxylesterase
LDPDTDVSFWDYSFVERLEDDRANIDFIRAQTGKEKISVIAHSEATASFWAGMSQYPTWYSEKVNVLIALGPISKLDNIKTTLLKSLANGYSIGLIKLFGIHEFFSVNFWTKLWFKNICGLVPQICRYSTSTISDGDTSVDDLSALRTYYGHYPNGISVKSLEHTLQIFMSKRFAYFDYGEETNLEKYGTRTPPLINLENVQGTPIALFVGNTDLLSDPKDNEWLRDQLGRNVVAYNTYDYGHITFFIGKDVKYLNDVLDLLHTFNNVQPDLTRSKFVLKESD